MGARWVEIERYTGIIMEILSSELDEHTETNYYREATEVIKASFRKNGQNITEKTAHALLWSTIKLMLDGISDPQGFIRHARASDIFDVLKPTLTKNLKDAGTQ